MTELVTSLEQMQKIRDRVFSVEQFEELLLTPFVNSIAGFGTFSLRHIVHGLSPSGISIRPWYNPINGREIINVALDKTVYEDLFPGISYDYENTIDSLMGNRSYGEEWEVTDFILERKRMQFTDPYDFDDVRREIMYAKSANEGASQIRSDVNIDLSPTEIDFLTQCNGVQVLFGDKEKFLNFLRKQEVKEVDGDAVVFYQAVPDDLVVGIIPLGPREERVLLSK